MFEPFWLMLSTVTTILGSLILKSFEVGELKKFQVSWSQFKQVMTLLRFCGYVIS